MNILSVFKIFTHHMVKLVYIYLTRWLLDSGLWIAGSQTLIARNLSLDFKWAVHIKMDRTESL